MNTPGTIDRDEIGTLALTFLFGVAAAGLPFLIAFARVLWVGLRTKTGGDTGVVVVFGKRLVANRPDAHYRARLETAVRVAAVSSGRILILGGRTGGARIIEASAGEQMLRKLPGGPELSIRLEQTSHDTLTNLRNARELMAESESSKPLTLISNRYHLARVAQMDAVVRGEGCAPFAQIVRALATAVGRKAPRRSCCRIGPSATTRSDSGPGFRIPPCCRCPGATSGTPAITAAFGPARSCRVGIPCSRGWRWSAPLGAAA